MINLFWRLLAKLLARPAIAAWLITRAQRTPYLHIRSADGQEVYMGPECVKTQGKPLL
ncbi:hypothetical protein A264_28319 [Pseudomonas syringae pv. actinidiae ICMP 19071]|uniref:hypothetical protein n=1 Tax=Pseudomonas syringae TaxID=317 RepID=UPI0003576410|nr:hypothetical protein [Pseudomonas syringae]EPM53078.1 hypothetical protein A264_28319 [Pseudomonas syringae pv. actinidiae ICMP 19071]EPM73735.1 hypothetical protein A3SO_28045 [Pseudomonas syringae pv. actinidiae ICMP 19072]OSN63665.1 hypothetical protein BV349_04403 [Pseudomonas syringae pv. actinidiae]OSN74076.1 hypothetical protein BV351_04323 [Pseudomonas syringae pv. actinidiae]